MSTLDLGASAPSIFNFQTDRIRITERDGEPWLVLADVMFALGYASEYKASRAATHIPVEWKGVQRMHTPGGPQEMVVISEQGLYFFLGRSDKEKAVPFQKWFYGEVLPSIRKTGSYSVRPEATLESMLNSGRYFMSVHNGRIVLQPVPEEAFVIAPSEFANVLSEPGSVPLSELPRIIGVCAERLSNTSLTAKS